MLQSISSLKSGGNAIELLLGIAWISRNIQSLEAFKKHMQCLRRNKEFNDVAEEAWLTMQRCGAIVLPEIAGLTNMIHAYENLVYICPSLQITKEQYRTPEIREWQVMEYEAIRLHFVGAEHFIRCGIPPMPRTTWKHLDSAQRNYLLSIHELQIDVRISASPPP